MRVIKEHFTHPDQSFRFLRFSTDIFRGQWHKHPQMELTWIERGAGVRMVGDNVSPFTSGDLVLLGSNVSHLWMGKPVADTPVSAASVIQFPPDLLANTALPELDRLSRSLARARVGLYITGACHRFITRQLIQMRSLDGLRRLAALFEIFDALSRYPDDQHVIATRPLREREPADSRRNTRIEPVIAWIHEHLATPLNLQDAARIAHITPGAFSRFFHRETGKTFTRYVNEIRCSAACLQLQSADKPIALIAEECGFSSLSNFNRQFLVMTGSTPRDYRRRA